MHAAAYVICEKMGKLKKQALKKNLSGKEEFKVALCNGEWI